uniref:Uncharacterized protein n=1 Tax=Candidatus Kentrum sp. FM TaxID=2126340 RepID=A0A450S2T3_9GAMM|nr:MAG: hypothetical protein BECKFM1743A_GA0114220_1002921 [Candidatus Kentron sp. FM]VFJ45987.1 MAG: hypothetical protein BECKFM1743C_GA0114222_1003221 [Candidatus Kentron sp. FM]VFK07444.1 MAG: hypothetical protein BECKFM1743B_GA0114221_1004021 [Candidatus Kentron sp. FM]
MRSTRRYEPGQGLAAKNLPDKQMKLEARGIGRWHYFKEVRADYFEQISSEVKAPHKSIEYRGAPTQKRAQERVLRTAMFFDYGG